jgi:4-amino-4-deoxy-L-arabinose transferase-like glycosyltransferase
VLGLPLRLTVIYAIVFAVAVLVYAAVWTDAPLVATDTNGYLEFARDLADGTIDDLHARTPGFPVLLLLTGSTEEPRRSLFYLSFILHCVSVLLLARLLDKAGLPATAVVCFGLLAMSPLFLQTAGWALSEGLTQFLLVCGIFALVAAIENISVPLALIAGLAFAGATLTRPLYQCVFLPLALLVWFCGRTKAHRTGRSTFRIAGVFVLAFLMPVLAYCSFNLARFGYFGVTYWLGHNLSTRTARIVQLLPDEYAETRSILTAVRDAELVRDPTPGSHSVHWYANHALTELERTTGLRDVALADYMLGLNLRLIMDHPLRYLREVAESFAGYWFPFVTRLARGPRTLTLIELLASRCSLSTRTATPPATWPRIGSRHD